MKIRHKAFQQVFCYSKNCGQNSAKFISYFPIVGQIFSAIGLVFHELNVKKRKKKGTYVYKKQAESMAVRIRAVISMTGLGCILFPLDIIGTCLHYQKKFAAHQYRKKHFKIIK